MKTLIEMIHDSYMPLNEEQRDCIKDVFKEWLRTVGLPHHCTVSSDGLVLNITDSLRTLLITLVDEPS